MHRAPKSGCRSQTVRRISARQARGRHVSWRPTSCTAVDEHTQQLDVAAPAVTSFVQSELTGDPARRVTISAQKRGTVVVVEGQRPLGEYMQLPASQYSVLDANKIERLDAETFRCHVGGIKFFNFVLEPVLTLRVRAHPCGCDIFMLACKMEGSEIIRAQNSKFASRMSNKVRWEQRADGQNELVSDTLVETDIQVPEWFVLPMGTIKSTGDAIMAKVLEQAVPKFLQQLERDYQAWASGDESRKPLGTGNL